MSESSSILTESGTNEVEIIEFLIDEELDGETYTGHYGINVAKVLEIIRRPQVTELPSAPHPSILGAFNLRNRVIPLIDLALWLGKPRPESDQEKVIVTEFNNVVNAFLVSGVTRIHRLSWEGIEPPASHVQGLTHDTLTGVVKFEDRVVFLLDMEKIIGDLNPGLYFKDDEPGEMGGDVQYKALVADDSTSVRRMIAGQLEKAGFEVTQTINGKEAWDLLQSWKAKAAEADRPLSDHVNLIISDIEMPVMDGHTLTRRIKEDSVLAALPVVLFSSLITDSLRHKGEGVGADDQISKPDLPGLAKRAKALVHRFMDAGT
jgi:two-component system, chemotaxis family, chemotaxis protein CheV